MSLPAIPGLNITALRALNGPNIWHRKPVLELELDAAAFAFTNWQAANELFRAQKIAGVELTETDSLPQWLGAAVVKVQREGRSPVEYHEWHAESGRLLIEFEEEVVGRAALEFVLRWLAALIQGAGMDLPREWETFCDLAYDTRLGNSTRPTVHAAVARGIPFYRLDTESLVQLGQGCHQRRVQRATSANTGFIANGISCDKKFTKTLLAEMGIPVPRGRTVSDADDACAAAREVGLPVVVKPQDGDYGNGVTMRITTEVEVRTAYAEARKWSDGVIVEHHVVGHLFRLLVIGGRLVAAVRREPWFVVGDGKRTLLELIEAANFDARRGSDYVSPFVLAHRQTGEWPVMTEDLRAHDSIPAAGETVPLKHDIYLRNDGIHLDQTDISHPEIARMAVEATALVGLDIAGLDVIATDLTQSPLEQEFVILEVNAEPAVILHMDPVCQPSRPVGEAIVDSLFPAGETGRIPLIVLLGNAEDLKTAREVAQQHEGGSRVGLASRQGVWLNGQPLGEPTQSLMQNACRLWRHPSVEKVVIHLTLDDVLREGLPFDRCDELIEGALDLSASGKQHVDRERALALVRKTCA